MDVYQFTERVAKSFKIKLGTKIRNRLVSTLRTAGIYEIDASNREIAKSILERRLFKMKKAHMLRLAQSRSRMRKANVEDTHGIPSGSHRKVFLDIMEKSKKGICVKCKQQMVTAKLTDGEEVNYCPNCRVTLWK